MGITGVQGRTGVTPAREPAQDGAKQRIEKQITEVKLEIKGIADDKTLTKEEKLIQKQQLEDELRSLNDRLRQQQTAERQKNAARRAERQAAGGSGAAGDVRGAGAAAAEHADSRAVQAGAAERAGASAAADETGARRADDKTSVENERPSQEARDGVILSISHSKDYVQRLSLVRTGLISRQRTAQTEDEKVELQRRIDEVTAGMGEKLRKISDAISDAHQKEEDRRSHMERLRAEEESRKEKRKLVISGMQNGPVSRRQIQAPQRTEDFTVAL